MNKTNRKYESLGGIFESGLRKCPDWSPVPLEAESFMSDMELWSWLLIIRQSQRGFFWFFWGIQGNKGPESWQDSCAGNYIIFLIFFPQIAAGEKESMFFLMLIGRKTKTPLFSMLLIGKDVVLLIQKKSVWRTCNCTLGSAGQVWGAAFNWEEKTYFFSYNIAILLIYFRKASHIYHSNLKQKKQLRFWRVFIKIMYPL